MNWVWSSLQLGRSSNLFAVDGFWRFGRCPLVGSSLTNRHLASFRKQDPARERLRKLRRCLKGTDGASGAAPWVDGPSGRAPASGGCLIDSVGPECRRGPAPALGIGFSVVVVVSFSSDIRVCRSLGRVVLCFFPGVRGYRGCLVLRGCRRK